MTPLRGIIARVLARLTDRRLADSMLGDLAEERARRAVHSRTAAAVFFTRAIAGLFGYLIALKFWDAVRAIPHLWHALRRAPDAVRPAIRSLRRSPWYAATAVGVIALGMTLATTVFAVVSDVLLRHLPYPNADELYRVTSGYSEAVLSRPGVSIRNRSGLGLSWVDAAELLAAAPQIRLTVVTAVSGEVPVGALSPAALARARVDPSFFDVIGVRPALGGFDEHDFFSSAEVTPAIISYGLWQQRFGGRLDVVGELLAPADGATTPPYRVAGVMPQGFSYPSNGRQPDVLLPLIVPIAQRANRNARQWSFIARVPAAAPLAAYRQAFDAVAGHGADELGNHGENGGAGPTDHIAVEPLGAWIDATPRSTAQQVLAVALLLVLLACVNVSGLVAMRGVDRTRELAVRRAIGARTADIAVSVLVESAVIVGSGALVAVAVAAPLLQFVRRVMPPSQAYTAPLFDWRVLVFAGAAAAATTSVVAMVATWRGARRSPSIALIDAQRAGRQARSVGRFAIVAAQVTLGMLVTAAGTLVVGSLLRASWSDQGFDSDQLVLIRGAFPTAPGSPADARAGLQSRRTAHAQAIDQLLATMRGLPGVTAAGATDAMVLAGGSPGGMFRGDTYAITDGFIEVMRPRLIEGRWPTAAEIAAGEDVVLLTPDAARSYFPAGPAVGQLLNPGSASAPPLRVIGVVSPARFPAWDWGSARWAQFYAPYRAASLLNGLTLVVRTTEPAPVIAWASTVARDPDAQVRLASAATANELLDTMIRPRRFESWVFGAFAAAALITVGVGVLGLVAMASARRRHEIGVRMTLGATRRGIVRLITREQTGAVLTGLLLGCGAVVVESLAIRSYVYGLQPFDPRIWIVTASLVLAVTFLGIAIPAVRASQVDPAEVLRAE